MGPRWQLAEASRGVGRRETRLRLSQDVRSHRVARSPSDASTRSGVTSSCRYLECLTSLGCIIPGDLYSLRAHTCRQLLSGRRKALKTILIAVQRSPIPVTLMPPSRVAVTVSSNCQSQTAHESRSVPCCSSSAQSPTEVCPLDFLVRVPVLFAVHGSPSGAAPAPDDLQLCQKFRRHRRYVFPLALAVHAAKAGPEAHQHVRD